MYELNKNYNIKENITDILFLIFSNSLIIKTWNIIVNLIAPEWKKNVQDLEALILFFYYILFAVLTLMAILVSYLLLLYILWLVTLSFNYFFFKNRGVNYYNGEEVLTELYNINRLSTIITIIMLGLNIKFPYDIISIILYFTFSLMNYRLIKKKIKTTII